MDSYHFFKLTLITLCLFFLSSCSQQPPSILNQVLERGELVVLTRLDSTTYQVNNNVASGFEHELSTLFAAKLGVRVRFILPNQFHDILKLTTQHEADFAAAGLSVTPQRQHLLHFTQPYYEVTQQLIYHYRSRRPRSLKYLNDSFFEVLAGSSHAENLRLLKKSNKSLSWVEATNTNVFDLITMVNDGLLDYTVADSNQFQTYRSQFPQLNHAFDISKPEQIAWAFPISDDNSLYEEAVTFLEEVKASGVLKQLQDKHFGYSKNLNYVSICTFRKHAQSRLPKIKRYFHNASDQYGIDWKLLAAVAYQESHWNPHAISPTGVRGIMMLTKATAKQMKILNRLDPEQSIDGGARYLATRIKKVPKRIAEPDRTWMALASYNIGFGHLEDARILTQQQGADPDKWIDVKERLPLLTQKKWYKKTKHGYARGKEPVTYVENVRQYVELLSKLQPSVESSHRIPQPIETRHIQLPAL
ncbi:MAG: membrane-bound lytic murein transglycosylase MltF [Piscirickettsiaceae bacterium]|nr:MAG: membrane-bound lytic murein transglycosylase MltF [Piscirickettsiaceae bacterium]PCI71204.1 MAG: membrane-bound lytic murein transglycosylase MltF [Piscirickettsiaceae bacterium]